LEIAPLNAVTSPLVPSPVKKPCSAADPLWYKDAIIYEIHVRAFADSNADGIGDFQGLISKLDYLQELGVTCLWLLPFFPSPLRDDGYDIADYVNVNPSYGTLADFQQFLDEAHARNMQVMIELVINHTSDQHPWFQKARNAPKGSPDRNMYVWSDTDKLYDGVRIIFTDTEKSNWTWDEVAQQYYWHRFFSHQPDLNFDNPRVMEEVLNAMRFWMDMGVDGLRLDAIPYLIERDGTSCENVPDTHTKIKEIRSAIDAEYENRLILAEANMWPADVRPYFGDDDECNMAFHFPLMPRIYMALRQEDRLPITDIMAQTPAIPDNCQWGLFLRNHDELTLEMVTDDERDYMNLAYAADTRMRINVGIRRRLAPLMDNNRRRIELLNSLLLSFPGTPIMYYGDEIGMGDNIYLGDRNGVRTPMQWNSDRNAGFSRSDPARLYFPVVMDPIYGYQTVNVEAQESDPSSLLQWTRNMIALRKLFQVFGRGTLEFLHPENRKILAYIRDCNFPDGHAETILCVANLSRFAQPVSLDLTKYAGRLPVEMLGYVPFPAIPDLPAGQTSAPAYPLTLAPYSFLWLELQPAPLRPVAPAVEHPTLAATSTLSITTALAEPWLKQIESLLPAYIAQQRWFGGKSKTIRSARITSSTPIPAADAVIAFVELSFSDDSTDLYQLPLALLPESNATPIRKAYPRSIIATLNQAKDPQVLLDASASPAFRSALLRRILDDASTTSFDLTAGHSAALNPEDLTNLPSRLGSAEQSNTSILYDQTAILKLFRRLPTGENPDVEVARFLTEVAHFPHIPAYLGDLHRTADGTTIAFLQAFAPNEGDGWAWTIDELGRFYESVANCPAPTPIPAPNLLDPAASTAELRDHAALYLDAARLLGQRTAEMQIALTTPSSDLAFTPEPTSAAHLAEDRNRIAQQTTAAFTGLEAALPTLPAEIVPLAQSLLDAKSQLVARTQHLSGDPTVFGQRIRIHGDYHLGQLLRAQNDFLLVDFEGEPAKPLQARRQKQSPLRDVAGMLRSFSYAARSALNTFTQRYPEKYATLELWATAWENAVGNAFLLGYTSTINQSKLSPAAQDAAQSMLSALLLEKALYELLYELNNRPTWLPIPLTGLLNLAQVATT
jgi:maltose alpha-D-glucosyltransferase/alpha-amylase